MKKMTNPNMEVVMERKSDFLKKLEKHEMKRQERMVLGICAIVALSIIVRFCLCGYF